MEERIRKAVGEALAKMGVREVSFTVERPADPTYGDYTTNVAMKVFGPISHGNLSNASGKTGSSKMYQWHPNIAQYRNPRELADSLARTLIDILGKDIASRAVVAGPGFINITLAREAIALAIAEADTQGAEWGKATLNAGQKVMIEYTDPNPFKEMHIGHLMSNAIGEAIARLTENAGAEVKRANYQGDVGPHVAKALWGLKQVGIADPSSAAELAKAYVAGNTAYEKDPQAKADIDAINQAVYRGDDAALMELWRKGRQISLDAFERNYHRLGTKFDYYFFESETAAPGAEMVRDGFVKGIFEQSDGAIIYPGEKKGLHTLVFITSKGTPTYEAKELGLAVLKETRWSGDRSLIVTANEQIGHFKVVKAALEDIAPKVGAKTSHIAHGFLRLATGKMSSREGNVISADDFIADVVMIASAKNPDPIVALQVAVGAIKYMILRQAPGSDIIFDKEKSLSLEGNSGPYLQYALVRARKILTYASGSGNGTIEPSAPYPIERIILHFPEVAARAARELSPNILTTYLTELAGAWNSFYAQEQVLGSPEEDYKQRVTRAFAHTMQNGLALLGIPAPEKM